MARILEKVDPDLVVMEATYGIVMALTLVLVAQLGIVNYTSRHTLVMAILGMDFVWGAIDMFAFFRSDITAERRRRHLLRKLHAEGVSESTRQEIMPEFEGTVADLVDGESRRKVADIIISGDIVEESRVVGRYRNYFINALTAFVVTAGTAIPVALCILFIESEDQAFLMSSLISSVMMFLVGVYFSPFERKVYGVLWGLLLTFTALALSVMCAFLGG